MIMYVVFECVFAITTKPLTASRPVVAPMSSPSVSISVSSPPMPVPPAAPVVARPSPRGSVQEKHKAQEG